MIYIKLKKEAKEKIKTLNEKLFEAIEQEEKKAEGFSSWDIENLIKLKRILIKNGFDGELSEDIGVERVINLYTNKL
jgi:hypothetical protein